MRLPAIFASSRAESTGFAPLPEAYSLAGFMQLTTCAMYPIRTFLLSGIASLMMTCGGADKPPPEQPRSVAGLLAEAKQHDREAAKHEVMARDPESAGTLDACVSPIDDVSTTGGERLVARRPCWTGLINPSERHRQEAERLRREAAQHRAEASALLRTEQQACSGIDQDEIDHSPFFHGEDILAAEPYVVDGALRGARVWFRKVPGLTVEWMRKDIACQQARAAVMGEDESFQSYCPLMLPGVTATVEDTARGLLVVLQAEREDVATAVLARAQNACTPPPPPDSAVTSRQPGR